MRLVNVLAACVLVSIAVAQPEIVWLDFDKVSIQGADYVYPESEIGISLAEGVPILGLVSWKDSDGMLSFMLDPTLSFTLQAFEVDAADPNVRTQTTLIVQASPEERLDYIVYQRVLWETKMNDLLAEEGFGYFEVSESIQRMRQRLIDEGVLPQP